MATVCWSRSAASLQRSLLDCRRSLDSLPDDVGVDLHGKTIFATGSTGFFGVWVHIAIDALRAGGCDVRLIRTSRTPEDFDQKWSRFSRSDWAIWANPCSMGNLGIQERFDFCLHMGASADAEANLSNPVDMIKSAFLGNVALADLCARNNARLLYTSSGAVYGRRSMVEAAANESDSTHSAPNPLDARHAYGESKRVGEMALALNDKLSFSVARPYAFMGPYLPLDKHFAAGNFLRDSYHGKPILVSGDGRPVRSYMYPSDLAAWLLWLMVHGPERSAINVGSREPITIHDLALKISSHAESPPPLIRGGCTDPDCYLPDLSHAYKLGLRLSTSLDECIEKSLRELVLLN